MRPKSSRWLVAAVFAIGIGLGGIVVAITVIPWKPTETSQFLPNDPPLPRFDQRDAPDNLKNDVQPERPSGKHNGEQANQSPPEVPSIPPEEPSESVTSGVVDTQPIEAIPPALPANIEMAAALKNFREGFGSDLVWDLVVEKPVVLKPNGLTVEAMGKFGIEIHNPWEEKIHYLGERMPVGENPTYWKFSYQRKKGKDETAENSPQELGRIYFFDPNNIKWEWRLNMQETVWGQAFLFCQMQFYLPPDPSNPPPGKTGIEPSVTVVLRKPDEADLMKIIGEGINWTPPSELDISLFEKIDFDNRQGFEEFPLQHQYKASREEPPSKTSGVEPTSEQKKQKGIVDLNNAKRVLSQFISEGFIHKATVNYELVKPPIDLNANNGTVNALRITLKPTLKIWFKKDSKSGKEEAADITENITLDKVNGEYDFKQSILKSRSKESEPIRTLANGLLPGKANSLIDLAIGELCKHYCKQINQHHAEWKFDLVIGEGESTVSLIHVKLKAKMPVVNAKSN